MTSTFDDPDAVWRECERSWATWLVHQRYTVTDLASAVGNTVGTAAPMIKTAAGLVRAPDLQTVRGGVTEFWEVKFRRRADVDPVTGVREHWMPLDSFRDYVKALRATQSEVWVVLYEAPSAHGGGRWLRAAIRGIRDTGHRGSRTGRSGQTLEAWVWPVSAMEVVEGPPVRLAGSRVPLLPPDGPQPALDDEDLDLAQRGARRRRAATASQPVESHPAAAAALEDDHALSLSVLARRLGLTVEPRYSVTRVGPLQGHADDLLDLLDHGIRLFLVTAEELQTELPPERLAAYRASRLLEHVVLPGLTETHWAVDGRTDTGRNALESVLQRADGLGGINAGQWHIVHADSASNVRVAAGAGTGKTETMSERLVFLLATSDDVVEHDGRRRPSPLTADQVALVTFTREAAREMRSRLARSLMLRQRLCRRCVAPVRAWMMQLGNAQVSTIHAFAKQVTRDRGGAVGFGPGFRVGQRLLEFRALLQQALSDDLVLLGSGEHAKRLPPAYAWEDHLEAVWAALENNGTPLMSLSGGAPTPLDWGSPRGEGLDSEVHRVTEAALSRAAAQFAALCRREQVVPTSQLVALAHAAVRATPRDPGASGVRHLFVDEFQDTDGLQIELLLDVHERLGPWMFVVGDVKQGIYRFRGAAGNAFSELDEQVSRRGLTDFSRFSLSRNFRSGSALLRSLGPFFDAWDGRGLLVHGDKDRLRPDPTTDDQSLPVDLRPVGYKQDLSAAAGQAAEWRRASSDESIAVLCRTNRQAKEVRALVVASGGTCELLVGGDFFRAPAVRETRALLEALVDPLDRSALLQLCETRWGPGVLGSQVHPDLDADGAAKWQLGQDVQVLAWADRVTGLRDGGTFRQEDLRVLETRLRLLAGLATRTSALSLVVDLVAWLAPDETATDDADDADDAERKRYRRCLDHLVTLMDDAFAERPASLRALLEWVRLQVATNTSEDEPVDVALATGRGTTLALTVHKAKGLEFDRVVVPSTTIKFQSDKPREGTDARVVTTGGHARLLYEWRPPSGAVLGNYVQDSEVAKEDVLETAREETRLLYVAMTRARKELVLMRPAPKPPVASPNSWAALLDLDLEASS